MVAEKELEALVEQLKSDAGANLVSVVLYGSAASGEFHQDYSDVNVLCVVRELSAAELEKLAPAVRSWTRHKHPAPLFFRREELAQAADVFAIEMLDIQQRHHMLYGEDVFLTLEVPMARHRIQLEHELRTKLLLLRQRALAAGDAKSLVRLMLEAVSSFISLFRHTLITMQEKPPKTKMEIVEALARKTGFDTKAFRDLLQVREHKMKADALDAGATLSGLLQGIEKAVQAVDAL
jgi:predicted nucleotidyltransferase